MGKLFGCLMRDISENINVLTTNSKMLLLLTTTIHSSNF